MYFFIATRCAGFLDWGGLDVPNVTAYPSANGQCTNQCTAVLYAGPLLCGDVAITGNKGLTMQQANYRDQK